LSDSWRCFFGGCASFHPEALPGSAPYPVGPLKVVIEIQAQLDVDCFEGRRPGAETLGRYKPRSHTIYTQEFPAKVYF
jgi:hypothetical protein